MLPIGKQSAARVSGLSLLLLCNQEQPYRVVYVLAPLRRVVKPSSGRKVAGERLTEGERGTYALLLFFNLRVLPQSRIRSTAPSRKEPLVGAKGASEKPRPSDSETARVKSLSLRVAKRRFAIAIDFNPPTPFHYPKSVARHRYQQGCAILIYYRKTRPPDIRS